MMARVLPSLPLNVTGRSQAVKHFLFDNLLDAGINVCNVRHHYVSNVVASVTIVTITGVADSWDLFANAPHRKVSLLCGQERSDELIALVRDQEWVAVQACKDPVLYLIVKMVCRDDWEICCFCEELVALFSPPRFRGNTIGHLFLASSDDDG